MKRLINVLLIIMIMAMMSGCDFSDFTDQAANFFDLDDENVLMVKGGHPNLYPDVSYEQAFTSFFSSPTWKYFVGTQEGSNNDGNGNADNAKENLDVVEFTGYCMYMNTEVKARIQFVLDKINGTFEASYLAFNEVPQSKLILNALLKKAFESYK
ncbi:MAG: hypothetical protein IKP88_18290 [Lachnospiraceae bacterium]|nr:hypothetical protein [Lachnospiraceae bacterium]